MFCLSNLFLFVLGRQTYVKSSVNIFNLSYEKENFNESLTETNLQN